MHLTILGTGYVGLVTGADFACRGIDVTCVDIDVARIEGLQQGVMPFHEKDLPERVADGVAAGLLHFTIDAAAATANANVVMCAVATPTNADGHADLSAVFAVADLFAAHAKSGAVLVNKSTVPVGTADVCGKRIRDFRQYSRPDPVAAVAVISNPEFLSQSTAVADTAHPTRIVVGVDVGDEWAGKVMRELNATFIEGGVPYVEMTTRSAEIVKCAANAFLATKISFINEIANFCERTGGNVDEVAKAIGLDPRIGADFLQAGLGYGGSCLSKDTRALIAAGNDAGYAFRILPNVEAVNDAQKFSLLDRYEREVGSFAGKRVAVWGVAFKAGTDDVRHSPALPIITRLISVGANVCVFDPLVTEEKIKFLIPDLTPPFSPFCKTALDAVRNADVLLIHTNAPEFAAYDIESIASVMRSAVILDGRRVFAGRVIPKNVRYFCVGCG